MAPLSWWVEVFLLSILHELQVTAREDGRGNVWSMWLDKSYGTRGGRSTGWFKTVGGHGYERHLLPLTQVTYK